MHDEPDPLNDTSPRTTPANALQRPGRHRRRGRRARYRADAGSAVPISDRCGDRRDVVCVAVRQRSVSKRTVRGAVRLGYFGDRYKMRFAAGFVGVRQDAQTLSVRPEIGWAVYDPAQVDAVRDHREKELAQLQREGQDRAFARAAAWSSKARCQRCGTWLYAYGGDPPSRHCDAPVVDVSYR